MRLHLLALGAVPLLMALSSCSTSPSAPTPSPSPTSGETSLTITFVDDNKDIKDTATLTCDPPGGSHPDAASACAVLAGVPDPFAPVPADAVCTQVFGGPQQATVTGKYRGADVDARFSREDGCQISRWDAIALAINPKSRPVG